MTDTARLSTAMAELERIQRWLIAIQLNPRASQSLRIIADSLEWQALKEEDGLARKLEERE